MPNQIHPDKASRTYSEWDDVLKVLQDEAKERKTSTGKKVEVATLIREATLAKANKILAKQGKQLLELDPTGDPVKHRGERMPKFRVVRQQHKKAA